MSDIRVTLITPIIAPYRIPVFNRLAELLNLRVVFLAESEAHRQWPIYREEIAFDYVVLPEWFRFQRAGTWYHASRGLVRELRVRRPQVVVTGGWEQPASLLAFGLRRRLGYRYVCWVESTLRDQREVRPWLTRLKTHIVASSDAIVVPGQAASRYVQSLGAQKGRIHVAPNAVDNAFWDLAAGVPRAGPPTFLFVGRLHPAKGVETLLDAWEQTLLPQGSSLHIVGDGPLRDVVRSRAADMGNVQVSGHLHRDDLRDAYAHADVFVLPTLSDTWGLVLNEAMASGLPIVSTPAPGAVDDLVEDGHNGLVVNPDAESLSSAMAALARDPERRRAMGQRSRIRIAPFEPVACANGIARAVLDAAASPAPAATPTVRVRDLP